LSNCNTLINPLSNPAAIILPWFALVDGAHDIHSPFPVNYYEYNSYCEIKSHTFNLESLPIVIATLWSGDTIKSAIYPEWKSIKHSYFYQSSDNFHIIPLLSNATQ
jgi:hypothetical protein